MLDAGDWFPHRAAFVGFLLEETGSSLSPMPAGSREKDTEAPALAGLRGPGEKLASALRGETLRVKTKPHSPQQGGKQNPNRERMAPTGSDGRKAQSSH